MIHDQVLRMECLKIAAAFEPGNDQHLMSCAKQLYEWVYYGENVHANCAVKEPTYGVHR